jgi:hypothetical protein
LVTMPPISLKTSSSGFVVRMYVITSQLAASPASP